QAMIHLDQVRSELQKQRGKQASIEALQQAALGQKDLPVLKWLSQQALDKNPRLAQGIEVETGWELAVEKVLGPYLQAVCVDQLTSLATQIADFSEGQLLAFANQGSHEEASSSPTLKAEKLLTKVHSSLPISSLLKDVYVAETHQQALALLSHLEAHESVITREGVWFSPTWFRVSHEKDPTLGVLQREQELKQLAQHILELDEQQQKIDKQLTEQQEQLAQLEQDRDKLQHSLNQVHARTAEMLAQQKAKQERRQEMKQQAEHLLQEQEEYRQQEKQTESELQKIKDSLAKAKVSQAGFKAEQDSLGAEREKFNQILQQARQNTDQSKELVHQLELRLQSTKSQQGALAHSKDRMQAQLSTIEERKQLLEKDLLQVEPLDHLKETLAATLEKHVAIEAELSRAREATESIELELEHLDKKRHLVEESSNQVRSHLETLRLDSQSLQLKEETLQQHIQEIGFSLEAVLKDLPPEAKVEEWQTECEKLANRIHRLGTINLIAVEEYATCQERKQYLDKQYEDLQASLSTLENAIAKIDRETRARFKETFDKINERFKELFPLVFGGGHAALELSDENLLEAGVAVMACPPGKRNSSIHLLSGGEKSMTAIALIFSIFHLNPSPLCLLDEVDAALDDMNVSRFCDLVKKMSEKTQFLFISHNKLAIEMAHHLIGITMHEPGVSRLVSVDVEEALRFATA
ncbi:MAG TPA: chromosome segregation protein SMC, partial [Gammaproteobacteria bacterium]|nr:chromosome segregation protein SMC [Gammaproteobacteria bacterium]